jgi:hypothetical protein
MVISHAFWNDNFHFLRFQTDHDRKIKIKSEKQLPVKKSLNSDGQQIKLHINTVLTVPWWQGQQHICHGGETGV